ncbi:MAG: flavodoxin domain-containing protein [Candidatus Peribacteraceae bacterium]
MPTLVAIYASTSGHTEFVVRALCAKLQTLLPELKIEQIRAERAETKDLERADLLLLASGTWNISGIEGQLNPHMSALFTERAKNVDLQEKPAAIVSLGDDRYHFTARATEHLQHFFREHRGKLLLPPLVIINEPYDQEERIGRWTEKLATSIKALKEWAALLSG